VCKIKIGYYLIIIGKNVRLNLKKSGTSLLVSHRESNVFGQSALSDVGEGLVGAPALDVLGHLGVRALALVYARVFLQRVMLQIHGKHKFRIGWR
jgi:hypothetical protein